MPEVDASRGTAVWGFNRFRSDALVQLLNDLWDCEKSGLADEQCRMVKDALKKVVGMATAIPDGGWLKNTVWTELHEFEQLYFQWNSHSGTDAPPKRKITLQAMRRKRDRISRKIRMNQLLLVSELDDKLIDDVYISLSELSRSLPDIFPHLNGAVNRFYKLSE
jgi:hypothetical protein